MMASLIQMHPLFRAAVAEHKAAADLMRALSESPKDTGKCIRLHCELAIAHTRVDEEAQSAGIKL